MCAIISHQYLLNKYRQFDSGFWGLSTDLYEENLFMGLCTHKPNHSAGFFRFNTTTKILELLFTIDQIIETKAGFLPQGKIHTKIVKGVDGNFYFGTHFSYPNCKPQTIQYEGGYLLSYNPSTGLVDNHGVLVPHEGILTLCLDQTKLRCYCLTSPSFYFVDYDIKNRQLNYLTRVTSNSSVCRSLGMDDKGNVYGSCESHQIFKYSPKKRSLKFLETNFQTISDKVMEWDGEFKQGANKVGRNLWRCIEFDTEKKVFFGINASTSKLFKFDQLKNKLNNIGETTNTDVKRVYPTLTLSKTGDAYYYVSANGKFDYQLSEDIRSTCRLIGFNSTTEELKNYGNIFTSKKEVLYGAGGATCININNSNTLFLIGAVSTDRYGKRSPLKFENTSYDLALLEINLTTLNQNSARKDLNL